MSTTTEITLLASAARTAAVNTDDVANARHKGVLVAIDFTAVTATPAVTFTIQGKDANGKYYDILASTAIATVSSYQMLVYPGATVAANVSASQPLPKYWRVKVTVGDTDSATYVVRATLLP